MNKTSFFVRISLKNVQKVPFYLSWFVWIILFIIENFSKTTNDDILRMQLLVLEGKQATNHSSSTLKSSALGTPLHLVTTFINTLVSVYSITLNYRVVGTFFANVLAGSRNSTFIVLSWITSCFPYLKFDFTHGEELTLLQP